jgi:hypothetical protein
MVFFADSNFFLQCKSIEQINWDTVTGDINVDIIVSRPVQEEIDKLKSDGNSRRAKKARNVNSMFREILLDANLNKCYVVKGKNVTLKFAENFKKSDLERHESSLDMSKPDDEIIATILHYKSLNESESYSLLTHDTNPILTAKKCGISFSMIPDDWLLQPEPDERDKTIAKLEQEIKHLSVSEPKIECDFLIEGEYANQSIKSLILNRVEKLERNVIDNLLSEQKKSHPMKQDFSEELNPKSAGGYNTNTIGLFNTFRKEYVPPTSKQIEEYQKVAYPNWLKDMGTFFNEYHSVASFNESIKRFTLTFKNFGNVPITNLIITLGVIDGTQLLNPSRSNNGDAHINPPNLSKVPKPPVGHWKTVFSGLNSCVEQMATLQRHDSSLLRNLISPLRKEEHDRYAFYWHKGRPAEDVTEWQFICDEFRHMSEEETFKYFLYFPENKNIKKLVFKVHMSGSNLKTPFSRIYEYNIEIKNKSIKQEIESFLELGATTGD